MSDHIGALLRQAQAGDRAALNALLERLRPHLELAARNFADPNRAAESVSDLVQEAGLQAWKSLNQFQGGSSDEETERMLLAWLAQIVRRTGIDAQRAATAQRRRPEGPLLALDHAPADASGPGLQPASAELTPSANVRASETTERVRMALAGLADDESRALLRLVFVEGLSLRAAGEQLQLTYDQVRLRYRKALEELEEKLAGLM